MEELKKLGERNLANMDDIKLVNSDVSRTERPVCNERLPNSIW